MNTIFHPESQISDFSKRLLAWYALHARAMPWRVAPDDHQQGVRADPYHVWLSEVMLQQTQVITVVGYFQKFISNWPTVYALARADEEDVLKAWAGLGYYSRARNLKKCADRIVVDYQGKFPKSYDELKKLPGIGDYTASAIASIAFDEPTPVLDGNVERVMARHQRIETFFPDAKGVTRELLAQLLDASAPGEFAQAMMDLGATICTPKNPACGLCPLNDDCGSAHRNDVHTFPRKRPKAKKPTRRGAAFVAENPSGEILLAKRPPSGLLAGMTQVPTTGWNSNTDGETSASAAPFSADWMKRGIARHTFTHFHLELVVWHTVFDGPTIDGAWWCLKDNLSEEAIPTLMRKVISVGLAQ